MVSYYNSLAMFPNRHAPQSSSPAAAAAAAAAAYLGYHGYHHHTHHPHHPHHHVQPSPPNPTTATHHQPHHLHHNVGHHLGHHQYGVENHDMGGGHPMGAMNHQHHHQYAPPTPPSQFDHSPHHHQHHHMHLQQESESPAGPVAWHSPVYTSRATEAYEGWSPQMQPPMAPGGSPPPPSSVTPDYKLTPDFSMAASSPAVLPMGSQQPQDLSNGSSGVALANTGPALQHSSPDSGLAGSSDGVSSSAGSPQHMHQLQHQMHPQMGHQGAMHLPMQPSQQVLLQVEEMRQQQTQQPPQTQTESQPRPQPVRSPYEWMKKPSYQSQPNPVETCLTSPSLLIGQNEDLPGKTRTKDKYRVVYSDRQRLELEKEFHYSRYITIRRKSELAAALGLSDRQVKIWFQNRRAKERKHLKKREEVSQKEKLDTDRDPMPPDLIPPQLSIPLHHSQHLHHHHPDMTEVPQQQQQPPMGLQMPGVATPGVDL